MSYTLFGRSLLAALRFFGCTGVVACPVKGTLVSPCQIKRCWDTCAPRTCLPENLRQQPIKRSTSKLKLVMTLVEEVHLDNRIHGNVQPTQITDSNLAADIFTPFFEDHLNMYEAMRVLFLDSSKRAKGVMTIGTGGIASTTTDHRLIFAAALNTLSPGLILAHNHPSGSLTPSKQDIEWTKRVVSVGQVHDIEVADHIILGREGHFSFRDHQLM